MNERCDPVSVSDMDPPRATCDTSATDTRGGGKFPRARGLESRARARPLRCALAFGAMGLIIVVSGLPRSGTSLMMRMLEAGGIELVTDGVRQADVDNPSGYFELERVKSLARDGAWLGEASGKAIKVISALLKHLPRAHHYKVLFMRRDLDEVLASQARMLEHRGTARDPEGDDALRREFTAHLAATESLLRDDAAFELLDVRYAALLDTPDVELARITAFLDADLDRAAMRACIAR